MSSASRFSVWYSGFDFMFGYPNMLRVYTCIHDAHDLRLVALAAVVCVVASFATVNLLAHARKTKDRMRGVWLCVAATASGFGIWATHFVAMIAYTPGIPSGYNAGLTILSLVTAIAITGVGLAVAAISLPLNAFILGGAIVGGGIAGMHYIGMAAFEVAGRIEWNATLVIVSLLLGVTFAAAALSVASRSDSLKSKVFGAALVTIAICGLHFTAMSAVSIIPDPTIVVSEAALPTAWLAIAVAGAALFVLFFAFVGLALDIREQERKKSEWHIRFLAQHDPLTLLPNRRSFDDRLDREIATHKASGRLMAVLCIDLDRFKEINDLFGHAGGDAALKKLAKCLPPALSADQMLARVGGDEFAIIAPNLPDPAAAGRLAEAIKAVLDRENATAEGAALLSMSVGISLYPRDAEDRVALLSQADTALYRAKSDGRGCYRFFEPIMDAQIHARRRLGHDLRAAIAHRELTLVYQPQAQLEIDEITGFEALLRWKHPERGYVPPSEFIPIAEESNAILQIGEWVLRTACREAASWPRPLSVAVNVSAVQLYANDFPQLVHAILFETGLSPSRLELEITETALIRDLPRALQTLRQLKARGVRIAMDDFGTGFSSLSNLRAFRFDRIKIDRSFIAAANTNTADTTIVRAILDIGRGLDISVLAEGVETSAELQFLKDERCVEVQGYLIGRPGPVEEFQNLTHGNDDPAGPTFVAKSRRVLS